MCMRGISSSRAASRWSVSAAASSKGAGMGTSRAARCVLSVMSPVCPRFELLYPAGDPPEQWRRARPETADALRQREAGDQVDEVVLAQVDQGEAQGERVGPS